MSKNSITKKVNIEEMKRNLEKHIQWAEKHPVLDWLRTEWYRLPRRPRDIYNFFKWGMQRWRRGWSDYDSWDIDEYLIYILIPMLQKLKKNKWGVPCEVFNEDDPVDETGNFTDEAQNNAKKRWDDILQIMINTFHTAELIKDGKYLYQHSDEWTWEWYNDTRERLKDLDIVVMRLDDVKRYEKGWKLFQKYFFSLWD